jgi:cytochrome P450
MAHLAFERSDPEIENRLTSPSFFDDPYPLYRDLRARRPVYWSSTFGSWLVTRFSDVVRALREPRLSGKRTTAFIDSQLPPEFQALVRPLAQQLSSFIAFTDPPDHTRLRKLINKAFDSRMAERIRPRIQQIVDDLIDDRKEVGTMDLIRHFAFPLPAIVIAETLGVPAEDRERFKGWADEYVPFITTGRLTLDIAQTAQAGLCAMREYLQVIVEQRRSSPRDDLLSRLLVAENEGETLREEELLSMCMTMLIGGHETTTNLIGNGTAALLHYPDQAQRLRRLSCLPENAIDEMLRFDSPLQRTFRVASEDLEVGGIQIRRGQVVAMMLGAANRDPLQFPQPERFDIGRRPNHHVAFGHGIHFCVGAALARMEAKVAIFTLLHRLPGLRLGPEVLEYQPTLGLRALRSLPIGFDRVLPRERHPPTT